MASDQDAANARGRLILDYMRAFLWPAVVLVVVLTYREDVRTILTEREIKFFGVEIGAKVADLEERTSQELADTRALIAQLTAGRDSEPSPESEALAADIDAKLDSIQANLSREVQQIQTAAPAPPVSEDFSSIGDRVAALEREGFEAFLDQDIKTAHESFKAAYRLRPDYHNLDEIQRLFANADRVQKLADGNPEAWNELYRQVVSKLSWGMPPDLRPAFRERVSQSY